MLIESWESLKIEILRGKEMKRNETEEEEEGARNEKLLTKTEAKSKRWWKDFKLK